MSDAFHTSMHEMIRSLSSGDFERACTELLKSMGFRNVCRIGHHNDRDTGRDIEATYPRRLPNVNGQINERWFFECKHQRRNLSVEDIQTKIAWAQAGGADFLVFLSLAQFTSSAHKFVSEYQARHGLRVLAWSGDELITLFKHHCRALENVIPNFRDNDSFIIHAQAEERIRVARSILHSIEVITPDLDAPTTALLEQLISKCVRREDIQAVKLEALDDRSSEIVYLLSASGNRVLDEAQLCVALAKALEKHPEDRVAWQIAEYLRIADDTAEVRTLRYLVMGPRCSGKSCLMAGILFEMLRDSRFKFAADTLLHMSHMHRSMRDGRLPPATLPSLGHGFRMHLSRRHFFGRRDTCIHFVDTGGETFSSVADGDSYWSESLQNFAHQGDKILLVFDPTGDRSILGDDDGEALPSTFSEESLEQYSRFLKWAHRIDLTVVPVITKVDLISDGELEGRVIPTVLSLLRATDKEVFPTSVLCKRGGLIVPQAFGIPEFVQWIGARR